MPKFYSSMDMTSRERYEWRSRANAGDAFELEGAYGDTVYLPKIVNDAEDAHVNYRRNRLLLESLKRIIKQVKEKKKGGFPVLLNRHPVT